MSDADPLEIAGTLLEQKYLIEKLVGEGGFAVVYKAQHTIWQKPVAIKLFNGLANAPEHQRADLQRDFINEGVLLTELSSKTPHIVQARDVGTLEVNGQWMPFMVLEWLEGSPLDAILEVEFAAARVFDLSEVYRLLTPVARGLDVAHGDGIAHRDIKPANIFVGGDPRSPDATVKVLDFGVAKVMSDNASLQAALARTGTNITSFTPSYGAPEQFSRNFGATGPWTDVFALALVAVEMMSGQQALGGTDMVQLGFAACNPDARPTPRSLSVELTPEVEQVFRVALSVAPGDRYARAGEFWDALGAAIPGVGAGKAGPGFTQAGHGAGLDLSPDDPLCMAATALPDVMAPITETPNLVTGQAPSTVDPTTVEPQATAPAKSGGSGKGLWVGLGALGLIAAVGVGVLALGGFGNGGGSSADNEKAGKKPAPKNSSGQANASAAAAAPAASAASQCPPRMAHIPMGQFFMGSDEPPARANEAPAHNVELAPYCVDLYEVTASEYVHCSDMGKCRRAPKTVEWPKISEKSRKVYSPLCTASDVKARGSHPINCLTWQMAKEYCQAQSKRLPTEAEWEYAARGPDGRVYPWGDEAPTAKHLNACGKECMTWAEGAGVNMKALFDVEDGYPATAPVGKFPAGSSRFGPHDIVGNVWEWVADWDAPYEAKAVKNPKGPATGSKRVQRGGAFNGSQASWLRPSFRYAALPDSRSHGTGFRCASSSK